MITNTKQMSYVTRWLFSTSHKDIGILYLGFGMISAMVATSMSVIIRMELSSGNSQFLHGNNQAYNVLVTGHAIAMIFLFVMPVLIGAFGNFLVPILIGGVDMAFARLNNISFWCLPPALVCVIASVLIEQGSGTGYGCGLDLLCAILNFLIILYIYNKTYNFNKTNNLNNMNPPASQGVHISSFKRNLKKDNKPIKDNISDNFWHYLSGLIEGDGSIKVPKNRRSASGDLRSPTITIIFNHKDYPLALKIAKILKYGNVYDNSNREQSCILAIQNREGVLDILNNINGKMRTHKINKLYELIDWYKLYHDINIKKLPLDTSDIGSNAWLAGFSDADSSFGVYLENKSNIKTTYRLSQKYNDTLSYNVLLEISEYLEAKLYDTVRNRVLKGKESTEYTTTVTVRSLKSCINTINYFNKYNLYSSKYLDYKLWETMVRLKENKKSYKDVNKYKELLLNTYNETRENMNTTRHTFNWDHLNNLK